MGVYGNKYGEYIHFKYANYCRSGLARRGEAAPQLGGLSKYVNDIKKEIQANISSQSMQAKLLQLEQFINYIRKPSADDGQLSKQEADQLRQSIYEYMKSMYESLSFEDIDWEHFTIKPTAVNKLTKNFDYSKLDLKLTIGTLRNSKANTYKKALYTQFLDTQKAIEQLTSLDQTSLDKIIALETRIKNQFNTIGISGRLKDTDGSFVKDIVKLRKEVFKVEAISQIEGDLMEAVAGQALGLITSQAQNSLNNLVTGSIKGKNIFYEKNFAKGLDIDKILGKGYQKSIEGNTWETKGNPKGKLDIYGQLDDTSIGANIKNYAFNNNNPHMKGISLVKDTNILYLLQSQISFVNHYLNQTVNSTDEDGKKFGPPSNIITHANSIMKEMLLLLAFAGGGYRTDITSGQKASIFIINDKTTGKVRLVSISSLFSAIVRNSKLLKQIDITLDKNQTWENRWLKESAQARITNLLAQVRAKPISVTVSSKTMEQALKFSSI